MAQTPLFKSKIGLVLATVGSAIGLGAVWRFPNQVHEGGGAAFLLVYIGCLLILGIPIMLAEFSLGRGVRSDLIGDFSKFTPKSLWPVTGGISLLAVYLINGFYMVVAGWTLQYFWESATGALYDFPATMESSNIYFTEKMSTVMTGTWSPIFWTLIVLLINAVVLLRGVQKGVEKMSNILMPLLFLLLIVLCCVTLTLPNASAGVSFFLKPDFSAITPAIYVKALGQAVFSLSIGMGILLTYGAYFPDNVNLPKTSLTVTGCTLLVSILMGLIIFPAVASFGLMSHDDSLEGTALVFITLPKVFSQMPWSCVWSAFFFLLLTIAAITSTLSTSEVCIKFFQDKFKWSRPKCILIFMLSLCVLSPICSLSNGPLQHLTISGMTIFGIFEYVSTNYLLPVAALLTCIYVGWKVPKGFLRREITNHGTLAGRYYPVISFAITYIAPLLIVAIFIYSFI